MIARAKSVLSDRYQSFDKQNRLKKCNKYIYRWELVFLQNYSIPESNLIRDVQMLQKKKKKQKSVIKSFFNVTIFIYARILRCVYVVIFNCILFFLAKT